MRKKTAIILILIALLIITTSCSAPNTIEVTSNDYPKLTKMEPGEFDRDLYYDAVIAYYKWRDYSCYVSVENGELCVSNRKADTSDTKSAFFSDGYLVGTDFGEFSGWLRWFLQEDLIYPEDGTPTVTETILSDHNCRFIIKPTRYSDYAFVVLDTICMMSNVEDDTEIYKFERVSDGLGYDYSLAFEKLAALDGECTAYLNCEEEECIYFATDRGITKLNYDGTVEKIVEDENFQYMYQITSIVIYDGEFYCGTALGIYRYNPETGDSLWYPMDFEKYVEQ